ncbi:hypothetical protein RJ46_16120 [Vibrio sinaloensis]|nr:hypothetical protein RJ46_16120 [Vibrio sinaloensis]
MDIFIVYLIKNTKPYKLHIFPFYCDHREAKAIEEPIEARCTCLKQKKPSNSGGRKRQWIIALKASCFDGKRPAEQAVNF